MKDEDFREGEICDCLVRHMNRQPLDAEGHHYICCAKEGVSVEKIVAHTVLSGQINRFLRVTNNTTVQSEPPKAFALPDPRSDKRLDLMCPRLGGVGGYDTTVTHQVPGSGLTMNQAKIPGRAVAKVD
jgi:hypothetical protein